MKNIMFWTLRIVAAAILLQTLYFKFSGHPQSVELFTKLGVEPWGRIGTGAIELITGLLLLMPKRVFLGAFLGFGLMVGAITSHLLILGIESMMDGGLLFTLAIIVLICCVILMIQYKPKNLNSIKQLI
jgi:putative oxidoreductase